MLLRQSALAVIAAACVSGCLITYGAGAMHTGPPGDQHRTTTKGWVAAAAGTLAAMGVAYMTISTAPKDESMPEAGTYFGPATSIFLAIAVIEAYDVLVYALAEYVE